MVFVSCGKQHGGCVQVETDFVCDLHQSTRCEGVCFFFNIFTQQTHPGGELHHTKFSGEFYISYASFRTCCLSDLFRSGAAGEKFFERRKKNCSPDGRFLFRSVLPALPPLQKVLINPKIDNN